MCKKLGGAQSSTAVSQSGVGSVGRAVGRLGHLVGQGEPTGEGGVRPCFGVAQSYQWVAAVSEGKRTKESGDGQCNFKSKGCEGL